ncbi:MAG: ATP-binding protein [Acidimicrobiia bacterium]
MSNSHDVDVDIADFERLASTPSSEPGAVEAWESAVELARGPFLDGFDADISEEWDTWLLTERAVLQAQLAATLRRLAELRERTGERSAAMTHTRSWIELDPWNERAQRMVIRLLALDGRPNAALVVAEGFARALESELGVAASSETMALIDEIRTGAFPVQADRTIGLPPRRTPVEPAQVCVGREVELGWLEQRLDDAGGGVGRTAFVAGPAGSGKTVLLEAFATRVATRMSRLQIVQGTCNAYTGVGDPFLPFRQVLGQLCGDIEREWARGALTPEEVSELWAGVPQAVATVLDYGPHLLGTLIDFAGLLRRLEAGFADHPVTAQLRTAVTAAEHRSMDPAQGRRPLIEQCTRVLTRLSRERALVVIVDDLQWADSGTLDVILDLARHRNESSLLLLAAFRPPEVSRDSSDPLQFVINEVGTASRAASTLEIVGTPEFVDACLNTESNRLDSEFRNRLYTATGGHALFTVEMIRALKQRGDLFQDSDGRWVASPTMSWASLPPRAEATIAARLEELPLELRRDLEMASVQGQVFSAEVVASARNVPAAEVILRLSSLDILPDSLIEENGTDGVPEVRINRFRFRHALFQQYLYDHISPALRRESHQAVAVAMEEMFAEQLDLVDVELARHFTAAGATMKAIEYRELAARRSISLSATAEAIRHLQLAVELLSSTMDSPDRSRRELTLLTLLGSCHQAHSGYNAPATNAVYDRLRELTSDVDPSVETAQALGALGTVAGLNAQYEDALENAQRLLEVARQLHATPIETVADLQLGWMLLLTGQLTEAERHLQRVIDTYDQEWDEWLTPTIGVHVLSSALAWQSIVHWHLGWPDTASSEGERSITLARDAKFPFGLAFALSIGGCLLARMLKEPEKIPGAAAEVAEIAAEEDFPFYRAAADVHGGIGLILSGDRKTGIRRLRQGLKGWATLGTDAFSTWSRIMMAMDLVGDGQLETAQCEIDVVEARMAAGGDPVAKFWLPLAKGLLRRQQGDLDDAERWFRDAVDIANDSAARGPELEAATELAQLLLDRGRPEEGRNVLAPVLGWFTEGLDTADVLKARAVLDQL